MDSATEGGEKETVRIGRITVPIGTAFALDNFTPTEIASKQGYVNTIPSRWFDLNRIGELEMVFTRLGIFYGKNDVYPAFKTKKDLDSALLKVYNAGWPDRWAIEDYLIEEGLIIKSVLNDLTKKGGLEQKHIEDLFSEDAYFGGGVYKNKTFSASWEKDQLLMISMAEDDDDLKKLVEAFSAVVGYKPFCKYTKSDLMTYEWAKNDAKERYQQLVQKGEKDLTLLVELT